MSEPKCTFTFTGASYDDIDDRPTAPDNEESLEPNGVRGDELLGEYAESSPVDWLEPLDLFVGFVDPCIRSQPFDGKGGGTLFETYALGWLALRLRLTWLFVSWAEGEVAPLLGSPLS
jgi:hypothetical protein